MKELAPRVFLALALSLAAPACGGSDTDAVTGDATAKSDPLLLPKSIVEWQDQRGWGRHHLEWHTVRRWDVLDASGRDWAERQGWDRAAKQEGAKGNGLEFLAMHRAMIRMLLEEFPKSSKYFTGWTEVPTNPRDKTSPMPHGGDEPFAEPMLAALERLSDEHIAEFESDDELGRFLETRMRPTSSNPGARSKDQSSGIHNYLHNRFMDPESEIDVGDPSVNLKNKMFWRLHGWIESRWTAFREAKGLTEDDPEYAEALEMARMHLEHTVKGVPGDPEPPPDSLLKSFEEDDSLDE